MDTHNNDDPNSLGDSSRSDILNFDVNEDDIEMTNLISTSQESDDYDDEDFVTNTTTRRNRDTFSTKIINDGTSNKRSCGLHNKFKICSIMIAFCIIFYVLTMMNYKIRTKNEKERYDTYIKGMTLSNIFPKELLLSKNVQNSKKQQQKPHLDHHDGNFEQRIPKKDGVYTLNDFRNDAGITAPYWEDVLTAYNVPPSPLSIQEEDKYYKDDKFNIDDEVDYGFNDESYNFIDTPNPLSKMNQTKLKTNNTLNEITAKSSIIVPHLGPCYLPQLQNEMNQIQWEHMIQKNFHHKHIERNITYPPSYTELQVTDSHHHHSTELKQKQSFSGTIFLQQNQLANYCRPGFIIIGAGKCGTSSLYHYLVGHNRVAPSKQKQIHYFKYFTRRPMSWYLSHFYSTQDFLSSGSLMTGEASPGYMPYPDVAHRIKVIMNTQAGNGIGQPVALPKIITIVRNPLERSYSSYNYNYIDPTFERIKADVEKARKRLDHKNRSKNSHSNKIKDIYGKPSSNNKKSPPRRKRKQRILKKASKDIHYKYSDMIDTIVSLNMTDDQIMKRYFFSFEEMILAELKLLKECLKKGGKGELGAKRLYGNKSWAKVLFQRREDSWNETKWKQSHHHSPHNLPPLITLDESCYGDFVSKKVPRRQWQELVDQHPHKIINVSNLHLVQSLLGRSIYSLPLEWWYDLYPNKDLYLVCNEDLKYRTSQTMSELSEFLGLPKFDFDDVVNKGMYNVGGNEGYDKVTTWGTQERNDDGSKEEATGNNDAIIPLSDGLKKEVLSFVEPYNERLFEISGKRCNW